MAWLSPVRFAGWLSSVGYTGGIPAGVLYGRLTGAAPGLEGAEGEARGAITLALVDTVEMINTRIAGIEDRIAEVFAGHPDRVVFASLPRSGTVRAANLLAEIGDCRQKFPTDTALAALAGVSPSPRQSGKREQTVFRWACNKKLRFAVVDFANGSRAVDPWAADVYRPTPLNAWVLDRLCRRSVDLNAGVAREFVRCQRDEVVDDKLALSMQLDWFVAVDDPGHPPLVRVERHGGRPAMACRLGTRRWTGPRACD